MSLISYKNHELYIEEMPLQRIADEYGTPCYVYSKQTIATNWHAYYDALQQSGHAFKINYAVKANSNINILKLLAQMGAGFDVVSGGEIERVLACGAKAKDIVFAGVGKTSAEIARALDLGIYSFHIESEAELLRINDIAQTKNKIAPIAFRVNPNVAANTHAYISTGTKENKFGVDYTKAIDLYLLAKSLSNIKIIGITSHIGSQITSMDPFLSAIDQLLVIIEQLQQHGIILEYIDIGGGLGIRYKDETPPTPQEYVSAVCNKLKDSKLEIHIEPGRSIVANAGLLLTTVEYLKTTGSNHFAIVDAAMNDLMRPALYQSYHDIVAVHESQQSLPEKYAQGFAIVGPICESGDFFALQIKRLLNIKSGDLLAIKDCGAYGFSMSSNYNTRPRCAEVLVNGTQATLIRRRETLEQLLENEQPHDKYAISS